MEHQHKEADRLVHILEEIDELLPSQGPIDVFIHHNTLHAFEHLAFEDAVEEAAQVYGAQAFLPEQRYLDEYQSGRISEQDLEKIVVQLIKDPQIFWGYSEHDLLKKFLVTAPPVESFQQVKWLLRESADRIPLQNISDKILRLWLEQHANGRKTDGLHSLNHETAESLEALIRAVPRGDDVKSSERFILWAAVLLSVSDAWNHRQPHTKNIEFDICEEMINPLLIRFSEEYLDLGFSNQLMPGRALGMLPAFFALIERAHYAIPKWLEPLRFDLEIYRKQDNPLDLLKELLSDLRVEEAEQRSFLLQEALSLKGWAGYVALVENKPEMLQAQQDEIKPKLLDFLNMRLIVKKYAQHSFLYRSKVAETPKESTELKTIDAVYCFAYHVLSFISAQGIGELFLSDSATAAALLRCLLSFDEVRRRRLWHLAYENNFYSRTLNALAHHSQKISSDIKRPQAQFLFCIDDREESIRRHLEARSDSYQTFGTAGFFGIDANYTLMSGTSAPYCPVIIKPTHAIREIPKEGLELRLSKYRKKQEAWFRVSGYVNRGSGSIVHSLVLSLAGCISVIPMIFGVIAPRSLQILSRLFGGESVIPHDLAELKLDTDIAELKLDSDGSTGSDMPGYTLDEMAERVTNVLRGIGLIDNFSDLIFLIGHGSSSRNNPLRSAYDCGACGGRPGRINARAFCIMANNPQVRALVVSRFGISIPQRTHFFGAFHNTCSDQIEYFDNEKCPELLLPLLEQVKGDLKSATKQNALERCRRFVRSRVKNSDQAAQEALARSYMLAEARPEYGHATNAMCIVGPRQLTTGLFLDRRSFLVSYDPKIDAEANILLGILRAVVPVCGGINLEYLFSAMDNEVYGAGTKLPHNIVSLVGIMNGTSSDLRTGLPTQMIEIHEPVRLLLVVVCQKAQIERVIESEENIKRCFNGGWIKLVLWNPDTHELEWRLPTGCFEKFEPSTEILLQVKKYSDWFMGKSNHLSFVEIAH